MSDLLEPRATETEHDWFETICRSAEHPPVFYRNMRLPGFPPEAVQVRTTGRSGRGALGETYRFYHLCDETFIERGVALGSSSRVLDFACGWGRITRFFLRDVPLDRLYGLDVMEEFIDLCENTFANGNFKVCNPWPPCGLETGFLTHIVGYSIFSHLSELACERWMEEFHRLLAPGGMLVLTTRSREFLDYCQSLRESGAVAYGGALGRMFPDFDTPRSAYDAGQFVHANPLELSGGGKMNSSFYGESFIPESYAARAWADRFKLLEYRGDSGPDFQASMIFERLP